MAEKTCKTCKWWRVHDEQLDLGWCVMPPPPWFTGHMGSGVVRGFNTDCQVHTPREEDDG